MKIPRNVQNRPANPETYILTNHPTSEISGTSQKALIRPLLIEHGPNHSRPDIFDAQKEFRD